MKRGFTLLESLLAMTLLLIMSLITTSLYRNVDSSILFATSRMESRRLLRHALTRMTPLLQTAYIPPIPAASRCYETPLAPHPAGVNVTDPLASNGPGVNSFLFYSPVDLLDPSGGLVPVAAQSVRLYELRLLEQLEPDLKADGRQPLVLRTLHLQARTVPVTFGVPPFPVIQGQFRVLARGLSDLRFHRISSIGVHIRLQAQGRSKTLNPGRQVFTDNLESKVYFPVVSN